MTEKATLTAAQAFAMQFDSLSLMLRTTMPGRVVGVDLDKNCVDVQPVLMGKMANESEPFILPVINHVPIQYYGAGDFWVTFLPSVGDYCVLSISDRSLDAWKKSGGVIDPKLSRHHDMTDALAYFGINPFPEAIPGVVPGMNIRTRDGQTGILLEQNKITVNVSGVDVCTANSVEVEFFVPVVAPEATIADVTQSTHVHSQGNDSDGNSQQDTEGPHN